MNDERQAATLRILDPDPEMAWRESMMTKVDDIQRDMKKVDALITDVRELTRIARDCFDELVRVKVEARKSEERLVAVEDEVRVLKAQVKELLGRE